MIACFFSHRLDSLDNSRIKLIGDGGRQNQDFHGFQTPERSPQKIRVIVKLANGVFDNVCGLGFNAVAAVQDAGNRRDGNTGKFGDIFDGSDGSFLLCNRLHI